ncbi:MAG: hypothetical protein ABIT05_06385 [Chitinophagaceae bacterium]
MKQRTTLLFAGILLLLVAACSKGGAPADDGSNGGGGSYNPIDTTAPVLDIYTPTANQVFVNGAVINVSGRIADDYGLYRGTIRIVNDANGSVMKEQQYEIHGVLSYNFSINYTAAVTVASDYTVSISFEDHGLHAVAKTVKIKVNP